MGAYIRREGKSDAFFFWGGGLHVNEPYKQEGKGLISGRGGLRNGSLRYTDNESGKRIHLFPVSFFSGIKETVSIWILELEVVKSQITV